MRFWHNHQRLWQGIALLHLFLVIFVGTLTLTQLGAPDDMKRCASSLAQTQWPKWLGCAMAAHESLTGGLIGSGGALFAAWLAWIAIQQQIRADRELAVRHEDATYEVICAELSEFVDLFTEIWRVIDCALAADDATTQTNGVVLVRTLSPGTGSLSRMSGAEELSSKLNPTRRRQFVDVMIGLRGVLKQLELKNELEPRFWLLFARTQLSHFAKYLAAFDPQAAIKFAERIKTNVDHRNTAEQIRPLVDEFIQHGQI